MTAVEFTITTVLLWTSSWQTWGVNSRKQDLEHKWVKCGQCLKFFHLNKWWMMKIAIKHQRWWKWNQSIGKFQITVTTKHYTH